MASDAVLRIPEEQLPQLEMLAKLPEASFGELAGAFAAAPMKFRTEELTAALRPTGKLLTSSEIDQAVEVVRDLSLVRAVAEVEIDEFVDDLRDAITFALSDRLSEPERSLLTTRMRELLSQPAVSAPAKARSLLIDHANYLCKARVFTDVRPVFGSDVEQTPTTALVVHTLKISYHQGAAIRDFFVVLDRKDLDELSALLERAKAKEKTLHVTLQAAGLEPLLTE